MPLPVGSLCGHYRSVNAFSMFLSCSCSILGWLSWCSRGSYIIITLLNERLIYIVSGQVVLEIGSHSLVCDLDCRKLTESTVAVVLSRPCTRGTLCRETVRLHLIVRCMSSWMLPGPGCELQLPRMWMMRTMIRGLI